MLNVHRKYNWHAVYLRYRTEKKVFDELILKNIECYLPLKVSKKFWSDRVKIITEPFFSGYIFVHVSSQEYYNVLVTPGVLRYVSFENKPAVISEAQIQMLKTFVDRVNDKIEITNERLQKGNIVKILNGPLKDMVGEVLEENKKRILLLRFIEMGYTVKVDLEQNEVELLDKRKIIHGLV